MAEPPGERCVSPRVDAEAAGKILSRRTFWRPRPLRVGVRGNGSLPFLERVWLPSYAVLYRTPTDAGVTCVVDGMSGVPAVFETDSLSFASDDDIDRFEPALSEPRAREIARETLLRGVLYRRRKSGISFGDPVGCHLVHYPYWVYYYRRRKLIDIRILDSVTGEKSGHKVKLGMLEAFRQRAHDDKERHGQAGH